MASVFNAGRYYFYCVFKQKAPWQYCLVLFCKSNAYKYKFVKDYIIQHVPILHTLSLFKILKSHF